MKETGTNANTTNAVGHAGMVEVRVVLYKESSKIG
jgi:hypothetical protein